MRKYLTVASVATAALFSSALAGTPIATGQLPKTATAFITKYFPSDKISKAEKDQGHRGTEYEVDLVSGAEIDFRSDGSWKEIKAARGKAVPAAVVPAAIAKYVSSKFPGQSIVEISRKRGGYEVELSNGQELKLTEDAQPYTGRGNGDRGNRRNQ